MITLLTVLAWLIFGGWALIGLIMLILSFVAVFMDDFTLGETIIGLLIGVIPSLINICVPIVFLLLALHFIPMIPA